MNDAEVPPAQDEGEFKLSGEAARAQWRRVRFDFWATFVVYGVALLLSWLVWHRTLAQLGWIALGLGALAIAMLLWRHNLMGYSYSTESGSEPTFIGKRPWVPRELAIPVLLVAAILLILAGTSTGFGRALASIFGVIKTLYDAGVNVWSAIWTPVEIVIILIIVGVVLYMTGAGVYLVLRFVFRGRRDPDEGTGIGLLIGGVVMLTFLTFMAWSIVRNRELMMSEFLKPFRTILEWLS
jgi:hypothetical protein